MNVRSSVAVGVTGVAVIAALFVVPAIAGAATAGSRSATAPPASVSATAAYPMDFTLPTLGKSGCMVCHGDRGLIRAKGDQSVSYYIDQAVVDASAHPRTNCTGCHLDFAYKAPHNSDTDWRRTARVACKSCHTAAWNAYTLGAHSISQQPGEKPDPKAASKPVCGDCHDSHAIQKLKNNPAGDAAMRAQGWQVCGRCHVEQWDNYSDYYHGAAYRSGALDAPACWDCHGTHEVLPSSNRLAPTNAENLLATCGKCHDGVSAKYVEYAGLVHRKQAALDANPVYSWMMRTKKALSGALGAMKSWFT